MQMESTPLEKERVQTPPLVPEQLRNLKNLKLRECNNDRTLDSLSAIFPLTKSLKPVQFDGAESETFQIESIKVGVVLSGGQAAGGHNVILGLCDALHALHPESQLIGFLNGPAGLIKNESRLLRQELVCQFRNLGGFDLIGSGRTKIETPEQFIAVADTVKAHQLDGLVIVGGDDSNTNAALLAEFFLKQGLKTAVVGAPKTIDGDLKSNEIEISFGFDTATKVYSEIIGNIARDAVSAKKYTHFIKIMGRSASHVALECALQTHPNYTAISEEVSMLGKSLKQITSEISDVIAQRAELGKHYGIILIPEGLLEFIPECKQLIGELNALLAPENPFKAEFENFGQQASALTVVANKLSDSAKSCFEAMPEEIRWQLLQDRDPHGNVQVSKIETERLLIATVQKELMEREIKGKYKGKFNPFPHFLGYEGRAGYPSLFDCNYCYALGRTAALLIAHKRSGYMAAVRGLAEPVESWKAEGVPFVGMIVMEERHGKPKPVIKKALVDLDGRPFRCFKEQRVHWAEEDCYRYPGPIQFFGPKEISEAITLTLRSESI